MVSKDVQHRGLRERARRTQTRGADRFDQVSKLRTYMHAVRDRVAQWLRSFSLDPKVIHARWAASWKALSARPTGRHAWRAAKWTQQVAGANV